MSSSDPFAAPNYIDREARLDEVLAAYIEADDAGVPLDRRQLLARHPDLAAELKEFFANRDRLARVMAPVRGPALHQGAKIRYLGDYELLETIAAGGMGLVFKARQVTLNRVVAVEMILAGALANDEEIERFQAEAEAAANLQHPGIVPIYEVGLHDGHHYYSMEFIDGQSLAELVRSELCTTRRAAELVQSAALTVQFAHEQGTLHRDLKPSNLLIDSHGCLRITDFGLAKRASDQRDLTQTGQALGTPAYMPPEQALGKQGLVGPHSDVYSLGAVLYELLTGRPPFRGESAIETLKQVESTEPVAPRVLNTGVPRDLETICLKCLAKEPAKRFASAQALAEDLGRFLRGESILARPTSRVERAWRWCRRNPVVATLSIASSALVLLTAIIATVAYFREADVSAHLAATVVELEQEKTLTGSLQGSVQELEQRRIQLDASLSIGEAKLKDDERRLFETSMQLASAAWNDDDVQLADYHLNQCPAHLRDDEWRQLKRSCYPEAKYFKGQRRVAISHDGRWLAGAGSCDEVRIWETATGKLAREWLGHGAVAGFAFSPDDRWLAVAAGNRIVIWNTADGTRHQELELADRAFTDVSFSPDGSRLAAVSDSALRGKQVAPSQVIVWNAKTLERECEFPGGKYVVFNRDGRRLATASSTICVWNLPEDGSAPEKPVLEIREANIDCRPAFHPLRDELAIACLWRRTVEIWDVEHARVVDRVPASGTINAVAYSQSGRRLALATTIDTSTLRASTHHVVIWNTITHQRERLLPWYAHATQRLAFSPNGEHLASADGRAITWWSVPPPHDPTEVILADIAKLQVGPRDWPQWGGSPSRINTPLGANIPSDWDAGRYPRRFGRRWLPKSSFVPENSRNIKWAAPLGSQSYGNPVVANGRVFLGTNNGAEYLRRYPRDVDLGVLLALDEQTGKFLWQHSNEKLTTGRVHDWPLQGVCSTPTVDGDRLWYVSNRGEVVCLDTEGFHDGEDDGLAEDATLSFLVDLRVDGELHSYYNHQPWIVEAMFTLGGAVLPRDWRLANAVGGTWRILGSDESEPPFYQIERRADQWLVHPIENGQVSEEPLFAIDNQWHQSAGLAEGEVSSQLRAALLAHGLELDDAAAVEGEAGRWQVKMKNGEQLTLRLEANGERLRATFPLRPNHLGEADVVWKFDMMTQLGVSQHNMANCSVLGVEGRLFVCTSNGVDESHISIPAPRAPSFIALDQQTGKLLWEDNSPGANIAHAQWCSPSYGVFGGQPTVIFAGGDGWVYGFDPAGNGQGGAKLLWKFDANPKTAQLMLGGRGTRNDIIAFPAIYDGLLYIVTGQDPEHGEGAGLLWCIDPAGYTQGEDLSPDLAVDRDGKILPVRRIQAVIPEQGEHVVPNRKSAVVWNYSQTDRDGNGKIDFDEQFHRSMCIPVIKDGILYIADFSGLFHCLNAKTGQVYWTYDMLAACWSSALLVDGKVYIADEDGDVAIFRHMVVPRLALEAVEKPDGGTEFVPLSSRWNPELIAELNMGEAVYMTPIVANDVLYVATKSTLYAIGAGRAEGAGQ